MTTSAERLGPDALAALMQSPTPHAVLDLRERGAYERGHIFRTTTLPRRLLEFRLPLLVPAAATPLALVDEDGALPALAWPTLNAMGYRDVRVLDGGLAGWRAAGRPLARARRQPGRAGRLAARPGGRRARRQAGGGRGGDPFRHSRRASRAARAAWRAERVRPRRADAGRVCGRSRGRRRLGARRPGRAGDRRVRGGASRVDRADLRRLRARHADRGLAAPH